MGKSFDNEISSKLTIRDGQSVWGNMLKRIMSTVNNNPTDYNIETRCYPYAKLTVGLDLCKDVDADPLHTSLPSGTYNGVAYTHSDTCLAAKYPQVAAGLKPVVEYWISQQYAVVDQVTTTLVIDAIGALIVCGTEIYGTALAEARVRSGFIAHDENNFSVGAFLFGHNGIANAHDLAQINGHADTAVGDIIGAVNFDMAAQQAAESTLSTHHAEGQSAFDANINYALTDCFMTPTLKSICEVFYSQVIKFRYADADTNRYLVCYPDAFIHQYEYARYADAAAFIKNLRDNHVNVILQRYTFMPNLMRSIGCIRLNGAKPSDLNKTPTNRICINTTGNSVSVVYDEADVIKNVIDHNAITGDEIFATLFGTTVKPLDTIARFIFTEADSYLNNELEIGDSILMNDGVISVLLHNGIRMYNSGFVDMYKAYNSSQCVTTYTCGYPKPIIFTSGAALPNATAAGVMALNELFNNTSLLDATWVPVFTTDSNIMKQEYEHINTGINTYAAPIADVNMIDEYAFTFICLDATTIAANNKELSEHPDRNNKAK